MTIGFCLLAATGLITVELFLWTRMLERCAALGHTATRSARVLRRRASDHWKERAITKLWLQMMRRTAVLAAIMLIVFLPVALLYLADLIWALGAFAGATFDPLHLVLLAALIGYAALRSRPALD